MGKWEKKAMVEMNWEVVEEKIDPKIKKWKHLKPQVAFSSSILPVAPFAMSGSCTRKTAQFFLGPSIGCHRGFCFYQEKRGTGSQAAVLTVFLDWSDRLSVEGRGLLHR